MVKVKHFLKRFKLVKIEKYQVSWEYWSEKEFGFIVTHQGKFIALGLNDWGQLGLGHNLPVEEEFEIPELCGKNIVEVFEGNCCMFALNGQGQVFSWGNNGFGRLGIGGVSDNKTYFKPTMIDFETNGVIKEIIDIKSGWLHNLALSRDGVVFGWGDNHCKQISESAHGDVEIHSKPFQMTSDQFKIQMIYCYDETSFMITENENKVYYYGVDIWKTRDYHLVDQNEMTKSDYIPPMLLPFKARFVICNDEHVLYVQQSETKKDLQLFELKNKKETRLYTSKIEQVDPFGAKLKKLKFSPRASLSSLSTLSPRSISSDSPFLSEEPSPMDTDPPSQVEVDGAGVFRDTQTHQNKYALLIQILEDIRKQLLSKKADFETRQGVFSPNLDNQFAINLSPTKHLWTTAQEILDNDDFDNFEYPEEIRIENYILIKEEQERLSRINSHKNFENIKQFNEGTFGKVFAAKEIATGNMFALRKTWYPGEEERAEDLKSIREIRIMKKLDGDLFVKFYHAWVEQDEFLYILMELCDDNLNNILIIKPGAFKRQTDQPMGTMEYFISWHMLWDLSEALNFLHSHKPKPILHRNLKPSNVMIVNNQLKIGDFGLAKEHDRSSHTSNQGSEKWMAPEVHNGRNYNLKADIYSLAVIALQILGFEIKNISSTSNRPILKSEWLSWYNGNPEKIYEKTNMQTMSSILQFLRSCLLSDDYNNRPDCQQFITEISKWVIDKNDVKSDPGYNYLYDDLKNCSNSFFVKFLDNKITK